VFFDTPIYIEREIQFQHYSFYVNMNVSCVYFLFSFYFPGLKQLSSNPLVVAVQSQGSVYLLQYNRRSRRITCSCNVPAGRVCCHRKEYEEWRRSGNGEEGENELHHLNPSASTTFESISKRSIPYPLPSELQQVSHLIVLK